MELIGDDWTEYERAMRRGRVTRPISVEMEFRWLRRQGTVTYPWVARITGTDPHFGLARQFVRCTKDYSEANSMGSRGVRGFYVLDSGIYEVNRRVSWKQIRR